MFGVGNEKELEAQFDRTQQVKKALLSRAGLGKEVNESTLVSMKIILTGRTSGRRSIRFWYSSYDETEWNATESVGTGWKVSSTFQSLLIFFLRSEVVPEAPTNGKKRWDDTSFHTLNHILQSRNILRGWILPKVGYGHSYSIHIWFMHWFAISKIPLKTLNIEANWEKTDIRDALREISSKTCIRFGEQNYKPNGYHINYVKIASATLWVSIPSLSPFFITFYPQNTRRNTNFPTLFQVTIELILRSIPVIFQSHK